jgi:hypothetical protein
VPADQGNGEAAQTPRPWLLASMTITGIVSPNQLSSRQVCGVCRVSDMSIHDLMYRISLQTDGAFPGT